MREVVITGLGPVSPNGVGKDKFWQALRDGKSGIRRITRFDPLGYPSQIAGEIPCEWVEAVEPFPANGRAWSTHLIIAAARLALQDANISPDEFSASRSGIMVGISTTDMGVVEKGLEYFKQNASAKAEILNSSFPHAAASELGVVFNCSGQVVTLSTGCPGGLFSLIYGAESIIKGEADLVIAGGGDAPVTPFVHSCFCASGFLSAAFNNEPSSASRSFDARRDGGVLAEGAGVVILEEAGRALARGANIYAKVAGWGITNAASLKQLGASIASSLEQSLQKAHLQPHEIDYICAHAPSDKLIDKMEVKAIKEVFGRYAYNLPVSSIKSMIGNPLAAAGPLQAIAAAKAIQEKFVPPTINYEFPDPSCDLDFVPNKGRMARMETSLVNLHGLGGCNASLVLTEA